jgi:hypothetical protein
MRSVKLWEDLRSQLRREVVVKKMAGLRAITPEELPELSPNEVEDSANLI